MLPGSKLGDSNAEPFAVMVSRGIDSLTVGIVSAAPSISDVSASLNLKYKITMILIRINGRVFIHEIYVVFDYIFKINLSLQNTNSLG